MKKGIREEASCLQHLGTGTLRSARKCAEVSDLLIAHFNPPHQSRCHFSNVCSFVLVGLLVHTELKGKLLPLPHHLAGDRAQASIRNGRVKNVAQRISSSSESSDSSSLIIIRVITDSSVGVPTSHVPSLVCACCGRMLLSLQHREKLSVWRNPHVQLSYFSFACFAS